MVQKVPGQSTRAPGTGEVISSRFLQEMSGQVGRLSRQVASWTGQEPLGEDGDGTAPPITLTETPGTAVFGAPQRIEDQTDPDLYVEVRNKIKVTAKDQTGTDVTINLEDTPQP